MKVSKKLFNSILCLVLSFTICVMACFAWFAMNENVSSNGLNTTLSDDFSIEVAAYKLTSSSTADGKVTYTIGSEIDGDNVKMNQYGTSLDSSSTTTNITTVLIKLTYTINAAGTYNLKIYPGTTYLNGKEIAGTTILSNSGGYVCNLSCAVGFGVDDITYNTNGTVTTTEWTTKEEQIEHGKQLMTSSGGSYSIASDSVVTVKEGITESGTAYVLMDYSDTFISYMYSELLKYDSNASINATFTFADDLQFRLEVATQSAA